MINAHTDNLTKRLNPVNAVWAAYPAKKTGKAVKGGRCNQKAKKRKTDELPVSKKFYAYIIHRIFETRNAIGITVSDFCHSTIWAIKKYLRSGTLPKAHKTDGSVLLTFYILKPEIDKAMKRSRRAREAAARRKVRRLAESCDNRQAESNNPDLQIPTASKNSNPVNAPPLSRSQLRRLRRARLKAWIKTQTLSENSS